jgi:hypothetical protein
MTGIKRWKGGKCFKEREISVVRFRVFLLIPFGFYFPWTFSMKTLFCLTSVKHLRCTVIETASRESPRDFLINQKGSLLLVFYSTLLKNDAQKFLRALSLPPTSVISLAFLNESCCAFLQYLKFFILMKSIRCSFTFQI